MKKKVIICPLDWGLGHASRMIPVAQLLIHKGFEVLFATYGASKEYLEKEFPDCQHLDLIGYHVKYSKRNNQVFAMLKLLPTMFISTIREHRNVKKIITDNGIDIIISDNRFGLWNKKIYSIFVTHQLKVIFPKYVKVFEKAYQWLLRRIIKKYDECWIPDFPGEMNLAGVLSHSNNQYSQINYIGPLSRFSKLEYTNSEIDVLFILSGPEPQRSIFEELIFQETKHSNLNLVIVRGTNQNQVIDFDFETYNLLETTELKKLIQKAKVVVSRSGYSSVMDLVNLGTNAILVPTPGQTEQEYLAWYLAKNRIFYSLGQEGFSINKVLKLAQKERNEFPKKEQKLLINQIKKLKDK